jgi:DNA-binding GntR family transcriptional regulator
MYYSNIFVKKAENASKKEKQKGMESGKSKKQLAYEKLKSMIIENEIPKDAPLVERTLCEQLGISRTPVREALRELANDDLVTIIDGKGVYVKKIDFKDMIEIFEVREALECKAIELFIERIDSETHELLIKYMDEQEEAYKKELHKEFMDIDMKIHFLIASGSKNKRLETLIISIYDQIRQIAISSKDDNIMREKAIAAHKVILKAIEDNDIDAAKKAMSDHIKETMDIHKDKYYLI